MNGGNEVRIQATRLFLNGTKKLWVNKKESDCLRPWDFIDGKVSDHKGTQGTYAIKDDGQLVVKIGGATTTWGWRPCGETKDLKMTCLGGTY